MSSHGRHSDRFRLPVKAAIVILLRDHPLVRLNERIRRVFVVGSYATGTAGRDSDLDVLLEVEPVSHFTEQQLTEHYRGKIQQYFMHHDVRGRADSVHPQWMGRRVDLYFTYDADKETRPKVELK